ncbi:MAG: hypothetical protein D6772_02465 [Bacteroidetes bacterium]|nr:MAG: hypothetical protein D6772_02465 [Bacteroidota bacterium]
MFNFLKSSPKQPIEESLELVSLHIPKTAGTSFRNTLYSEYGRKSVLRVDVRIRKEPIIEIEQKLIDPSSPRLPDGIRVVHGHFRVVDLHRHFPVTKGLPMITWLRDPVERVLSNYYYLSKRLREEVGNNAQALSLIKRLERSLIEYARRRPNRNRMTQFLEGTKLEDYLFVGIQEHYSEDIKALSQLMGWKTAKEYNFNASKKDRNIDPAILEEIKALNSEDVALYEAGLALRAARTQNK